MWSLDFPRFMKIVPDRFVLCLTFFGFLFFLNHQSEGAESKDRPNVLFIAVDDLRVELGCYGSDHVKSPNIDRLASRGTVFERAYCQQTVCNPSRASMLTGRRPDTLRVWDLPTHFRKNSPDVITLPQWFKQSGYHSQCVGKIFHNWRQDEWKGDPVSWSVPSVLHYNSHGNDKPQVEGEVPLDVSKLKLTESRDVPDEAYFDGRVANTAVETLRELKAKKQPFFFAVGFWKPHTPFNAPKKYWDLYDPEKIPLPEDTSIPRDVPEIALTGDRFKGDEAELRELHHGHLAAISYLDAQIGKVLDELDALELRDNTVIVFWSDHGLHIGEHGLMRKTTAFELDARVPMIISTPEHRKSQRSQSPVELLDVYPTLVDLCGLDSPAGLEGISLRPVLEAPEASVKAVALTQTPRPNYLRGKMPEVMGYSIRAKDHRYTEWRDFKSGKVLERELYDHRKDPGETINVVKNQAAGDSLLTDLAAQLQTVLDQSGENSGSVSAAPHPVTNPTSARMLADGVLPDNPKAEDFKNLPKLPSQHAMLSDVRDKAGTRVHQHAYLSHHGGRYWAMWSDGPGGPQKGVSAERHRNVVPHHDQAGTRVSYATSKDGVKWSQPDDLSGPPFEEGSGWIARGLWKRDGELLALASHFKAPSYAGEGLSLEAFRWDESAGKWQALGQVRDDSMNNFPPKKLPGTEQWMMTRRDGQRQVSVMIGGEKAFDDWKIHPMASYNGKGRPEEPYWYVLPDGKNLVGLIRDNGRSGRLLRTFSTDNGRSWSAITRTDFPDATSKFFVLRTSRGYYAMVSNSNPKRRDPLTLAISEDGLVFTDLFYLVGGRHIDYPHLIEHDGHLLVAYSGAKQTMEVLKISLDDIDAGRSKPEEAK